MPPWIRWFLGSDRFIELAHVGTLFAIYLVLDRLTRAAARISSDTIHHRVFLAGAAIESPAAWLALSALLVGATMWRRARLFSPWLVLDQGATLRWMCGVTVALTSWLAAVYQYNFLADQWHILDRLTIVALALASLHRPTFLVPLALAVRVASAQFVLPFGTVAGPNIDALLATALTGFAALHLRYALTGVTRSASIVLLLSTMVASHFFVPGAGKAALGWFGVDHLWNFPLSAYTAGWLGHTPGDWARLMAQLMAPLNLPLQLGTLVVELGSGVAVMHPRLLRWWLPCAIAFHVFVFALTGFWFLAWVAVEATLLVVVWAPRLRAWVAQNATPARGLLAAGVVVFAGDRLYQPPTLSWFDGPVSYGYELEGVGVSGTSYHVPLGVAAPFEQELNFLRLRLSATREASDAYGAVGTLDRLEALQGIASFEALEVYERSLPGPTPREIDDARQFLARLLEHINRDGRAPWFLWSLPTHFWSSRPSPRYTYQEPLARLDAVRVTALHRSDGHVFRREPLVVVHAGR